LKQRVEFTSAALSSLSRIGKVHRQLILEGIRNHLVQNDPTETSRNKFPLRRPSLHAERELRLDNWRVFYTVMEDGYLVLVTLIGEKRGNKLLIDAEEFEL
jgi:mRNA-degrading endonuclease RelE of RelBE toxin-antitoxin system